MRRRMWRCAEVNTWAKVIYCDRIDRIAIDCRPMLMSILHAAPQHTPSVQCASVSETWRKKRRQTFRPVFSISSFLSVLASFAFGRPLVVRSHGHCFVDMRLCRCLRRTHNSYLHATKCLACVINAKISTCKLFVCVFWSHPVRSDLVFSVVRKYIVLSFRCALQAFDALRHPSSARSELIHNGSFQLKSIRDQIRNEIELDSSNGAAAEIGHFSCFNFKLNTDSDVQAEKMFVFTI